jgi:hypothetical protein
MLDLIKSQISIKDSGEADAPEDLFVQTLPEDLTEATVNKFMEHRNNFTANVAKAFGQASVDFLNNNPGIKETKLNCNIGTSDVYNVKIKRPYNYKEGNTSIEGNLELYEFYRVNFGKQDRKKLREELAELYRNNTNSK